MVYESLFNHPKVSNNYQSINIILIISKVIILYYINNNVEYFLYLFNKLLYACI